MDLILFHSETDMPIYVEKGSPLLEKLRQVVLVDQITDIQLIKTVYGMVYMRCLLGMHL